MDTAIFTRQVQGMGWKGWLYSIVTAFIGGGASAVTSWLGIAGAHAAGVDVPNLNFKATGVVFLSSACIHVFTVLAKSPLPPLPTDPPNTQPSKQ